MSTPVRVRFAPSPTGHLHIGGVRSSLFNWLWARHNGGAFILRIEDTDRARLVEGSLEQIIATHDALGITPDEGPTQGGNYGPYLQSERLDIYRTHADSLVESGDLYPCWCSPERLTELREAAQKDGVAFKYDRHCLQPENKRSLDESHVLRFHIPDAPAIVGWEDAVRGHLESATKEQDDFVALKADGFPTYHFANVVDDHLMEISHVLRADEWIPSTPKHLLLYTAFGWDAPIFAHLPAILGPTGGKKLSKRDGAQSAEEFIEEGYLPEALLSFLATLGWNDGSTQEVYTTEELIQHFTLDRIQKSPAKLDRERLTWINGLIIRQMSTKELLQRCEGFWPAEAADQDEDYRLEVLGLVQERLKFLSELPELTDFFFTEPTPSPMLLTKAMDAPQAATTLSELTTLLGDASWTPEGLEAALRAYCEAHDLKTGSVFGLVRVAMTGRTAAPGLFETMVALGQEAVIIRLKHAQKLLGV